MNGERRISVVACVDEDLINRSIRVALKSMNRGEYDEHWVIRPIPKDTQNGGRNTPVPLLLYCLRLVPHNSNFDLTSFCSFHL
jgi:hypothetical protein